MPYLLDTCTFFWLSSEPERLSERARAAIEENPGDLFVSAISAFEFGIKERKGKFHFPLETEEWFRSLLKELGITQVPINFQIATQSTQLPSIHTDPCDRIIIATAKEYKMQILTPDKLIHQYPEARCVW